MARLGMSEKMTDQVLGIIDRLADNRTLVFRFFVVFSRFECALKRSAFLEKGRYGEALPGWEKYGDELKGRFATVQDDRFRSACAYLEKRPPNTQIVNGKGLLDWKPTLRREGDFDERYLLRLVRTVRNNLFHGGKYQDPIGPIKDVTRDPQLLENAIIVLEQCLTLNPKVNMSYEEIDQ